MQSRLGHRDQHLDVAADHPGALARQVGTTTTTVARQWLYTLRARHQADPIAYHRSYLSQVERGRQVPTEQFAI